MWLLVGGGWVVPWWAVASPPEANLRRTYSEPTAKVRCVIDDVFLSAFCCFHSKTHAKRPHEAMLTSES